MLRQPLCFSRSYLVVQVQVRLVLRPEQSRQLRIANKEQSSPRSQNGGLQLPSYDQGATPGQVVESGTASAVTIFLLVGDPLRLDKYLPLAVTQTERNSPPGKTCRVA